MAHFAEIDENGTVLRVLVVNNSDIDGGTFPASEPVGQAYLAGLGLGGAWLQCSYSGSFRGAYPGSNGWTYDAELDEFVFPPDPPIDPDMPVRVVEIPAP